MENMITIKSTNLQMPTLRKGNYDVWSSIMRDIFDARGLNGYLDDEFDLCKEENAYAKLLLKSSLNFTNLKYVCNCETVGQIWSRLKSIYETNQAGVPELSLSYRTKSIAENSNVIKKIIEKESQAKILSKLGEPISEAELVNQIIPLLPQSLSENFEKHWLAGKKEADELDKRTVNDLIIAIRQARMLKRWLIS